MTEEEKAAAAAAERATQEAERVASDAAAKEAREREERDVPAKDVQRDLRRSVSQVASRGRGASKEEGADVQEDRRDEARPSLLRPQPTGDE